MSDSRKTRKFSRRQALKAGLAAGAVVSAPAFIRSSWAKSGPLIIANSGGAMGEAKRTALYDPFTSKTGIEITTVAGADMAKLRLQVEQGAVEWDVVDVGHAALPTANRLNLFEPIDEGIVNWEGIVEDARNPFAIGATIYAGGIGYPTDRLKAPTTWTEFFDVENFPGRRGLRTRVNDTLEIAAMGSGVPPSEVFPIDVERAFAALDRLKPHVSHWISATAQTVSLIQQNETDFTFTYTTRVKKMQESGVPMGFSFRNNILGISWTGVPRGSKNREAAMQFLNFALDPDRQAELANLSVDAPTHVDAMSKVDPAIGKWLPDVASTDNCFTDAEWWSTNLEPLTIRYKEWLVS